MIIGSNVTVGWQLVPQGNSVCLGAFGKMSGSHCRRFRPSPHPLPLLLILPLFRSFPPVRERLEKERKRDSHKCTSYGSNFRRTEYFRNTGNWWDPHGGLKPWSWLSRTKTHTSSLNKHKLDYHYPGCQRSFRSPAASERVVLVGERLRDSSSQLRRSIPPTRKENLWHPG